MRLVASLYLGFMMVLTAATGAAAQTWSEYRSTEGRYRIQMPGKPEVSTEKVEVNGRELPLMEALVEVAGTVYLVTYIDYSAEEISSLTALKILDNARDGAARGSKLVSDRFLMVSGYPAREYVAERDQGMVFVTRSVMAGARLYQMIIVTLTSGGGADNPLTRRFIDSFAITAAPPQ